MGVVSTHRSDRRCVLLAVRWLSAQEHWGETAGIRTHAIFVELKERPVTDAGEGPLGPSST